MEKEEDESQSTKTLNEWGHEWGLKWDFSDKQCGWIEGLIRLSPVIPWRVEQTLWTLTIASILPAPASHWAIQRQQNPERVWERTQQRFAHTLPLQHSILHQNIVSHPLIAWCWFCAFLWLAVKSIFFAGTELKINRKEDIDQCVRTRTEMLSCRKRPSVICLSLPYQSPTTPVTLSVCSKQCWHCDLVGMLTLLIQQCVMF